ncbi:unnamed protein product [Brassica rapa subsp. trilocularis]
MENQPDINVRMIGILVDWLTELMEETLYLTINLIDRFVAVTQHVPRKKLQLVEVSVPVVDDLIVISDKAYTRREVLDMEKLMANTLQFNFCLPTPYVELLSFFIIELCLVEYEMLQYVLSDVPGVFQTRFQTAPLDLDTESFYLIRKETRVTARESCKRND